MGKDRNRLDDVSDCLFVLIIGCTMIAALLIFVYAVFNLI